jgi:hypothetical protein
MIDWCLTPTLAVFQLYRGEGLSTYIGRNVPYWCRYTISFLKQIKNWFWNSLIWQVFIQQLVVLCFSIDNSGMEISMILISNHLILFLYSFAVWCWKPKSILYGNVVHIYIKFKSTSQLSYLLVFKDDTCFKSIHVITRGGHFHKVNV